MTIDLLVIAIFLIIGILLGGLIGWFLAKSRVLARAIPLDELEKRYVIKEVFDALQNQADMYREDLQEKLEEVKILTGKVSASEQAMIGLEDRLTHQKNEVEALQKQSKLEFEQLANRLLEEKSQKFTDQNQRQLQDILMPLREKIKTFEDGIEKRFVEETRDRISLKKEIEHLRELNQQLSTDANNLVSALKGENKTQGDWGEIQLELILEKAGLNKDIHYQVQNSFRDENGQQKRPDFIINLPEEKHLVIDCKVSLVAYEKYFNATKKESQKKHLKAHVNSLRAHVKDLSSKNYQHLYDINSPDYLLLFVPIEPAFGLALQEDSKLFLDALDQNIVMVTTSTLLATMRTVSYIWKQEKQKKSVLEIARQSGLLYDKFCGFVEDLSQIGQRLGQAQGAYHDAMNKLKDSKKYGDTLVGRAEKIKELGARTSKSLPKDLLESANEETIDESI
ncbi:MAG: DNA recombination protein RmuC [Saprospiraceae bacterium]|nr:MAG: DNA recombination protein RmuC [Saprospiraceae bacterium]